MDGIAQTTNDMEQHLLFHKALIDDNSDCARIDNYLEILSQDSCGEKMADPVDEAIRSVFGLVFENGMDPWEIDLREFTRLYSQKVKENTFDMIVAGKLVLMAWKVLRMQSDRTLFKSEDHVEELEEDFDFSDDVDDFTALFVPEMEMREAFRREAILRPVTMIELLDAFEEARTEIAISEERERVRIALKAAEPKKFDNKAHDEDDEKIIEEVWGRIEKLGTGAISMADIYTEDMLDNIRTFVSVLHLVRDGKLTVWQDELPYGEIFVEIKLDWMSGTVEDNSPMQKIATR